MMQHTPAPHGRLAFLPISFFSVVMGLSGLTIAWEKAQHVFHRDLSINVGMLAVTVGVFALLFLLYVSKAWRYPQNVAQELAHPITQRGLFRR